MILSKVFVTNRYKESERLTESLSWATIFSELGANTAISHRGSDAVRLCGLVLARRYIYLIYIAGDGSSYWEADHSGWCRYAKSPPFDFFFFQT